MRKCASLLLAILLLCVSVACQPTPEEDYVVQRGSEVLSEKLEQGTPIPVEQTPAPEEVVSYKEQVDGYKASLPSRWSDRIETSVELTIDAEIVVSNEESFPVYIVEQSQFDLRQVEDVANRFFSGITGIREGSQPLPEEYAAAISSLNARGFVEYAEAMFKEMQEASEGSYTDTDHISLTEKANQRYTVRFGDGALGKIAISESGIIFDSHFNSIVHLKDMVEDDGSYEGEGSVSVNPPITQEQAEEVLTAFLQENGLEGFTVETVSAARHFAFLTREEINQGWKFTLMRTYGYYAVDTFFTSEGWFRYEDDAYSQPWRREVVSVYISENGVEYFSWQNPMEVTGAASPNVELMDFAQIQENAKKLLTAGLSWMESDYWKGEMNKMVLTVMVQQMEGETDKAYLMPVWVMFSDWYFDGGDAVTMAVGINALDGSRAIMN